jgi:hypothetical protein
VSCTVRYPSPLSNRIACTSAANRANASTCVNSCEASRVWSAWAMDNAVCTTARSLSTRSLTIRSCIIVAPRAIEAIRASAESPTRHANLVRSLRWLSIRVRPSTDIGRTHKLRGTGKESLNCGRFLASRWATPRPVPITPTPPSRSAAIAVRVANRRRKTLPPAGSARISGGQLRSDRGPEQTRRRDKHCRIAAAVRR